MLLYILLGMLIFAGLWVLIDFQRFRVAKKKSVKEAKATNVDAGGILLIMGGKTYYDMPNKVRRKIADYPMDLIPGSADMNQFTAIMEQARNECHEEASKERKQAIKNIHEVAKEEAKL